MNDRRRAIDTFSYFRMTTLIMALLTFRAADIFYRYTIHFTRLQVFMEFFVNAIEFIPISRCHPENSLS